ncbi:MAG: tRNA pseudouridine(55) synthase TruB [candidate division WOR-3 bacterium]
MVNTTINLIFNIDKEEDLPSFKVVKRFRNIFKEKKVGFLGTLDPFASGVLPLFSGNFTKLITFLEDCDKVYDALIEFGILTDTFDITGKIVERKNQKIKIHEKDIEKVINEFFLGEQLQTVPKYSAVKIEGERAYNLARRGIMFEEKRKKVFMKDFKIIYFDGKNLNIQLKVKKGFYVRSFAKELAEKLDTYGTVVKLRRLENGFFKIADAKKIDDIKIEDSKKPEEILKGIMDTLEVDFKDFNILKNGNFLKLKNNFDKRLVLVKNEKNYIVAENKNGFIYPKRCIV